MIAVLGAIAVFRAGSGFVFEDAYISYRYARNIADGLGFVFQPGERVLGTMPFYTLVLALGARLGADIPTLGTLIFSGSIAAIAIFGGLVLRRLGSPNAALLFAALCMCGFTRCYQYFGLETPLITALMLAALLAALNGRDLSAGALAALAFLTRYDAALFAMLLLLALWLARRHVPWKAGLVSLAIALPWLVFARVYFGSWMPNTLAAKADDVAMFSYLQRSASLIGTEAWRPLQNLGGAAISSPTSRSIANLVAIAGILLAAWLLRRRDPPFLLLLLSPIAVWLGYAWIGPPVEFAWYLVPGTYMLLIAAFAGWSLALRRIGWQRTRCFATLGLATWLMALQPAALLRGVQEFEDSEYYRTRIGAYGALSDWVVAHQLTALTLLTAEPGYFTYRSRNPVIDAAGLVTKDVYFFGNRHPRTEFGDLIADRAPPLIVAQYPYRTADYVLVQTAFPVMQLLLSREKHRELFDSLAPLPGTSEDDLRPALKHPFSLDVESTSSREWNARGGALKYIGHPFELTIDGKPVREVYLCLQSFMSGAETPPFLIDFDRLQFRFASTNQGQDQLDETVAQLIIDGRVALQEGGRKDRVGTDFPLVSWPLHSWRGRTAQLRFVNVSTEQRWLAADHITSAVDRNRVCLDDFEDPRSFGKFWRPTKLPGPTDMRALARDLGLEFWTTDHAATTHGISGAQKLVSRRFVIDHDRLSCVLFDFGSRLTALALVVDGRVRREVRGRQSRKVRPVSWDLREFRGKRAILLLSDQAPESADWIGIDDLYLSDD